MKKILLSSMLLIGSLFANTLSEIKEKGILRIGVWEEQPPFSQLIEGSFSGFEIDFANEIAKNLFGEKKGKIEFIGLEVVDREKFLMKNKVDLVIATFTITDERLKKVDFSLPYFSTNQGILTKKDNNVQKIADLRGKKIIVEDGALGQLFFKSKGFETVVCHNSNQCYKMLKEGAGDAYANDNVIVLAYPVIDRDVEVNIKNLGESDFFGIGVSKGNKELLDFVNNTLIKLSKEGFFRKSFKNTIDPFYKGTAEQKYFLLEDIYKIFG
ncbi:amino acid ABC transporter substrate-binding protein [Campylobacter ureolyticus]|uniref:transporter substrate-binding domain-containing protein n=1 Tax=Campylobacter ureolyticus TaxID=827 RepID=UPI001FC807A2|nr:transporter substrate-binding domain-containing protein [Campylobacter ureolyticus]GKH60703.1 amino acid ABC transporter substrate-binding protein [Campylobacter ureolyticus]